MDIKEEDPNISPEDNNNKLNINSKHEDEGKSGRELISKENNEEEKVKVYKKNEGEEKKAKKEQLKDEQKINDKKTSGKDGEVIGKDQKKGHKLPIIPYVVSGSYQQALINTLKKENRLRVKTLLQPDFDDITRNIKDLDDEEMEEDNKQKLEDLNIEEKEREDKTFLNKYKESSLSGNTLVQDPMALFSCSERVYIDQFYKLSDLFVICPLYFNYRISLEYCISPPSNSGKGQEPKEYAAYHLFNTKEISPVCGHNCCPNQAREININIFNFILESKERDRRIQKFINIKKNYRCALSCLCACCSRPTFIVETPIEQLGKIIEVRTVCDPILNVIDINNDVNYVIKAKFCDCGYCCRDQCCDNRKCASCKFSIFDGTQENELGTIEKDHRSGKKVKPDYDQLVVNFPKTASCQDKVMLMCSALVIEYLYFQNLTNTKRCSGQPRFMHASS